MYLFLDDERRPNEVAQYKNEHEYKDEERWEVVKSYYEFTSYSQLE